MEVLLYYLMDVGTRGSVLKPVFIELLTRVMKTDCQRLIRIHPHEVLKDSQNHTKTGALLLT